MVQKFCAVFFFGAPFPKPIKADRKRTVHMPGNKSGSVPSGGGDIDRTSVFPASAHGQWRNHGIAAYNCGMKNKMMKSMKTLTAAFLSLMLGITSVCAEETDNDAPFETEEISDTRSGEELPQEREDAEGTDETPREEPSPSAETSSQEENLPEEESKETTEENPIENPEEKKEERPEEQAEEELAASEEDAGEEEKESSEGKSGYVIPEGFELQPEDIEGKKAIEAHGMIAEIESMEEGVDYAEGQVILFAKDDEYALTCAEIYRGTLLSFDEGIAVIGLSEEDSVKEAVLASWRNEELPLIEPDYLVSFDEPEPEEDFRGGTSDSYVLPKTRTWESTVYDLFDAPDPYLKETTASTYQWFHEYIGTYAAWSATMGSEEILVAVIDYSVNGDHEELKGKVTAEDIGCGSYLGSGHGTGVGGTIAALADNKKGGAGIAPNVRILSINIFKNTSTASASNIAKAIIRAIECGADIINFSVGSRKYSYIEEQAVNAAYDAGIPFVAAAGNDGANIQVFPAAYQNSIAVAATDRSGLRASFSNYGSWITVSAPGVSIRMPSSSWSDPSSRYSTASGTSFAAPIVTGALALYMSKMGKIGPDEAVKLLNSSCTKCSSAEMGAGIISLNRLFQTDQAQPLIHVYDKDDNEITSFASPLPEGCYIKMEAVTPGDQDLIAYTVDGSEVKLKNGELINGEVYLPETRIPVDRFPKNSTVSIKALAVSSFGAAGKKTSISIKTPVPPVVYKIKTVKLDHSSASLYLPDTEAERASVTLEPSELINTAGESVSLDSVPHTWISSNPSAAAVDENGKVTAAGKGTATIRLRLLDGSGKTASCSIEVVQYAESIEISGQDSIAPGCSAALKRTVLPSSANHKSVSWSIREPVGGITISSSGTVKVAKSVEPGTVFTVVAAAKDGSGVIGEKTIKVQPKASAIKILTEDPRAEYNAKGVLKSIRLFASDLHDSAHREDEREAVFTAEITGNDIPPVWKSSNVKVAEVDQSGTVKATGKGTATITCTANDGSGKKASFTVSVTIPVSYVRFAFGNNTSVAIGQSLNLKKYTSFGTAYGTPSRKEASWEIETVVSSGTWGEKDITEEVTAGKHIILSAGALKPEKSLQNLVDFSESVVYVTVRATAADGTDFSDTARILVSGTMEGLKFEDLDSTYYECMPDSSYTTFLYSQYPVKYEISSSNPKIAGAYIEYTSEKPVEFEYKKNGKWITCSGYQYRVRIYTYPEKTGKATITVKALDCGSRKTTLKVRVSNP